MALLTILKGTSIILIIKRSEKYFYRINPPKLYDSLQLLNYKAIKLTKHNLLYKNGVMDLNKEIHKNIYQRLIMYEEKQP